MLCGDPAQIPNEISAGSAMLQFLLTVPIFGWIAYQVRTVMRDVVSWIKKRRDIRKESIKR
jgi:hypothetical protein